MPAIGFNCPNGKQTPFEECFRECQMKEEFDAGRCLSIRTLRAIADQREWKGIPSTTQLLRGTRECFLQITQPYFIDPQQNLFSLHGTKVHAKLEEYTPEGSLSEERIFDDVSSGAFDFYEDKVLYDVKTYGSFAVAKTLGLHPRFVADGVYVRGPKKGQTKWKQVWESGGRKSRFDLGVQLNDYRMKLESTGRPVEKMICEILVRDGNTQVAKSRGIDFNGRLVEVNKISDHWVKTFMKEKARRLHEALATGTLPPLCKPRERWFSTKYGNSMKCMNYCVVRHLCDYGRTQMGGEES